MPSATTTSGEYQAPQDPGLQLINYRLAKIEDGQLQHIERHTVIMSRLDTIIEAQHQASLVQVQLTERVKRLDDEASDTDKRVKALEDKARSAPGGTSGLQRKPSGVDSKFWTILATALGALSTAIYSIVSGNQERGQIEHNKTVIELPQYPPPPSSKK